VREDKDGSGERAVPEGSAGAVLVAAGAGERMGLAAGRPKALLDLGGVPLAAHSLALFEESEAVGAVVLVAPRGMISVFREKLVEAHGARKVIAVVEGGATRQESVRLGLEALPGGFDPIVVHDAARPLLARRTLDLAIRKGASFGACVPVVPLAGTVKRVSREGLVVETLDRSSLREAQTPQVFRASEIRRAHREALDRGFQATDDAALAEWAGVAVAAVEGDPENLKITTPVDLAVAEAILARRGGRSGER